MTITLVLVATALFLAWSNGANDNFKGVATLFGSATTSYKKALLWATATTFAGSLTSLFFATKLVSAFSGKGLVPAEVAASQAFLAAVALGAAITVTLATRYGFPISTTHALTGALVGAGMGAVGGEVNFARMGTAYFLPLLVSPLVAISGAFFLYKFFRALRVRLGVEEETCICIGAGEFVPIAAANTMAMSPNPMIQIADSKECVSRYTGDVMGFSAHEALEKAHYLSSGVLSFARGLQDTPKIVALMVGASALSLPKSMLLVGIAIALGGLASWRVAETISQKITPMNQGQGFTANVVAAFLVIFASRMGVPVSTTHVSVGAIFGIGQARGEAHASVVGQILLSWILTLPIAAIAAGVVYTLQPLLILEE